MKGEPWCSPRWKTLLLASTIQVLRLTPGISSFCRMPAHILRRRCQAGYLPIPKKLASKGVKDMVRISDARMSGTAFGTIVLHVTPDSASGGPLGLARTGDRIRLSVKQRRVDLVVDDAELKRRAAASKPPLARWSAAMRVFIPRKSWAPIKAAIFHSCGRNDLPGFRASSAKFTPT